MSREPDMIAVEGANGDHCIISHEDYTWGPLLAPKSTGLFDMAIQTNYGPGMFGPTYQSWKPKARDVVWTIDVTNPRTGMKIDQDSDLWHTIYSRWRNMFDPAKEATVVYTSIDGERRLKLRTLQASLSVSSRNFEGKDPHLFAAGSVVQTMRAALPFYVGKSLRFSWETPSAGSHWFTLPYYNAASFDAWTEWDIDGGCRWILPDYSFGSEAHGRGMNDLGKTVPIPELLPGENTTVMTRPDMEWLISEWETRPWLRSPGFRHEYPIPPGMGNPDPNKGCVVRCLDAVSAGLGCVLTIPQWYAEPFSTPRLIAA